MTEASKTRPKPDTSEIPFKSRAEEFYDLLDLAERIQGSYESSLRSETLWRFIEASLLLLGVVLLIAVPLSGEKFLGPWTGVGAASLFYALGINVTLLRRIKVRSRSDRRALQATLGLVRETKGVALPARLPAVQRAEVQIRLSRFEIEPPRTALSQVLRRR